jgi:pyridoxamine 5'-phosphate oxidase
VPSSTDPIARLRRWLAAARRQRDPLFETMALATSGRDRAPSVRFVLLAHCDARGLTFCCSSASRKAVELAASPHAAVAFYWQRFARQARVEGPVEQISSAEVERYWKAYSREAQLATWAAEEECDTEVSRAAFVRAYGRTARRFARRSPPLPSGWCGYRVLPVAIEFWEERVRHLHERERFERSRRGWTRRHLVP